MTEVVEAPLVRLVAENARGASVRSHVEGDHSVEPLHHTNRSIADVVRILHLARRVEPGTAVREIVDVS